MNPISSLFASVTKYFSAGVAISVAVLLSGTSLLARDPSPIVTYLPRTTLVEGDQPLYITNTLSIKSPSNVPSGQQTSITPVITVLSSPAGSSNEEALGYISISPSTLVFTEPNQTVTATIISNVPAGKMAGDYAYQIATPGWPAGTVDNYGFVNMTVSGATPPQPPSVSLQAPFDGSTYTYTVGTPALSIPLQFQATSTDAAPITQLSANISGSPIELTTAGMGTNYANATGAISLSAGGIYTITASATSSAGTSIATVEITVNQTFPLPTVSISKPAPNANYTYTTGNPPLSIPFSFEANGQGDAVSVVSATLNGAPVAVIASGLGTPNATGSGTFLVSAAGEYTVIATAINSAGSTSASQSFTVVVQDPPATLTIVYPSDGAVYCHRSGYPPLYIPFFFTAKATTGSTISALRATLDGDPVCVWPFGLGTGTARGFGFLRVSSAGTHTFAATAVSNGSTVTSQVSFTVVEPLPNLNWLPPISLGKVQKGGSTLPIKFQLKYGSFSGCGNDDPVVDTSVKIAIYEVLSNGDSSDAQIFSCGSNPNPPTYKINACGIYHLNFPTEDGAHRYHIDVYRFSEGSSTPQLIGTKEFTTR